MNVICAFWKTIRRVVPMLILTAVLLVPAYAAEDIKLSDARAPRGNYTATLEEMAAKRLSVYGFLDDTPRNGAEGGDSAHQEEPVLPLSTDGTPNRLDAALLLYRACGTRPEAPCRFTDVPEEYKDAVAWLYGVGGTKGVGNGLFGVNAVTCDQYLTMLSRLLGWETEELSIIEYLMEKIGVVPLQSVDGVFTFGEMYQMTAALLDYAYPERCAPVNGKAETPDTLEVTVDSYEDAIRQFREAASFLPHSIDVRFRENCAREEIERFRELFNWSGGRKTMPLLELMDPRRGTPFSVETISFGHYRITLEHYSQASEASASISNWLDVYQDEQFCDCLREFYLTSIFPLKRLSAYERARRSHDLICELASYDHTEYDNSRKTATGARPKAHDLIGFIENRNIVCDGYANLYSWMLMELDIDSYVVIGRADGGGHAWNKLLLCGKWYNVDVCWDDTGATPYRYFLKSDDWMMENRHSYTDSFSLTGFPCDMSYANNQTKNSVIEVSFYYPSTS